jgi:hypothetical protein
MRGELSWRVDSLSPGGGKDSQKQELSWDTLSPRVVSREQVVGRSLGIAWIFLALPVKLWVEVLFLFQHRSLKGRLW